MTAAGVPFISRTSNSAPLSVYLPGVFEAIFHYFSKSETRPPDTHCQPRVAVLFRTAMPFCSAEHRRLVSDGIG